MQASQDVELHYYCTSLQEVAGTITNHHLQMYKTTAGILLSIYKDPKLEEGERPFSIVPGKEMCTFTDAKKNSLRT